MTPDVVVVPPSRNGPAGSAHGGYTCGRLAALVPPPDGAVAAVTLLTPPPLAVPLRLVRGVRRTSVWHGDELVATVSSAPARVPVVDPVTSDQATAAARDFRGRARHPFPTCFACGPDRSDGLRLTPGPVPGAPHTVACPWRPAAGPVPAETVWSALDCPGGWVEDDGATRVLSRMAAEIMTLPPGGQPLVVVARRESWHGRTITTASALYDSAGLLLARAVAVWTELDPVHV